ncbi:MAG: sporulation protein YabP [Oscillospiraceae bacterium]
MAYEEKYKATEAPHNVIIEGRSRVSVSGVTDVESFDETVVVINTTRGVLIVRGEGLHMEKLSLDSGEIIIEGNISALEYEEEARSGDGFFARLFK